MRFIVIFQCSYQMVKAILNSRLLIIKMHRLLMQNLISWKEQETRKPLLLDGAR